MKRFLPIRFLAKTDNWRLGNKRKEAKVAEKRGENLFLGALRLLRLCVSPALTTNPISRNHAVGQASRLSLTLNGRLEALVSSLGRTSPKGNGNFIDGDRRDACPTRRVAASPPGSTAWFRISLIRFAILLVLFAVGGHAGLAAPLTTNAAVANRLLLIDASSMPVAAGKATLIIGPLQRTNGVYVGDYRVKVFPYFFKNEKGRLAMAVPDAALIAIRQGQTVAITGTATTSGKKGRTRHIEATATPADLNGGQLKLWFTAGELKMVFAPAYHFAETETARIQTSATNNPVHHL